MAVDGDGKVCGVGVKAEHMALPVLLDRGLTRLELSEAERQFAGDLQIVEKHGSPRAQVTGRGCEVGFR